MTTTKALKILDMFLYKQCDLSRTEPYYDEGTVWDAVKMARDSLENKGPDPSEEKERIIESLRDAIEMLEEKEYTEQDVREAYNSGYACGCEQKKEIFSKDSCKECKTPEQMCLGCIRFLGRHMVDRYTSGEENDERT